MVLAPARLRTTAMNTQNALDPIRGNIIVNRWLHQIISNRNKFSYINNTYCLSTRNPKSKPSCRKNKLVNLLFRLLSLEKERKKERSLSGSQFAKTEREIGKNAEEPVYFQPLCAREGGTNVFYKYVRALLLHVLAAVRTRVALLVISYNKATYSPVIERLPKFAGLLFLSPSFSNPTTTTVALDIKRVYIDKKNFLSSFCLLYTSPSPRDQA